LQKVIANATVCRAKSIGCDHVDGLIG
jgi:hypothetical protein